MPIKQKIYFNIGLTVLLIAVMFGYILPKMSQGLINLQNSHKDQITKLKQLNEQAKSLSKMNEDLAVLKNMPVQPDNFFTSDVNLVNEIKTLENIAAQTSNTITLSISGTADKAQSVQSASGLSAVPYSITLDGTYPSVVQFINYMEHRYFVAPINGLKISAVPDKPGVNAVILSNFYIFKPVAAVPAKAAPATGTTKPVPAQ